MNSWHDRVRLLEKQVQLLIIENSKLKQLLAAYENPHTPSAKKRSKKNTNHDDAARFPGKPKGGNGGGISMPEPDKEVHVTKEDCPNCENKLDVHKTYSFCQMDIPEPKVFTTKYFIDICKCKKCGLIVDCGAGLPKGYYGPNISAMIGSLKTEALSFEATARFFRDMYGTKFCNVTAYNKLNKFSDRLTLNRENIRNQIFASPSNTMDESGFRKDGKNGYVWHLSTPSWCLFEYDKSRSAAVAKRLLGNYRGALTTDDYKGYVWYPERQLCWAHLLRESKEAAEKNPDSKVQHQRLQQIYKEAVHAQEKRDTSAYSRLLEKLLDVARCYHPLEGCKKLYTKLITKVKLWLYGLKNFAAQMTNNQAERCLRKVVLHRNRIGCIRKEAGERFINIFLSCTATWRLQDKCVFRNLLGYTNRT